MVLPRYSWPPVVSTLRERDHPRRRLRVHETRETYEIVIARCETVMTRASSSIDPRT